ncbi:MAG: hypothetical protein JOS17DRAFT_745866 [Linnemannia elongata]|nr:MAG: hypothetical protein JOS17DRAFT_745866 [Linnemannia elongata]
MSEPTALQFFLMDYKPKHFTAKPGQSAKEWLTMVDRYFSLLKLTPQERAECVLLLLDGLAEKWANNLPKAAENEDPWQYFRSQFLRRFQDQMNSFLVRQKLYQLKQFSSVAKYNFQFDTLRSELDDIGEDEAIHRYLAGLNPKLREYFAGNPTLRTNLDAMMGIAESLDNALFQNGSQFQPSYSMPGQKSESFPQLIKLDSISHSALYRKLDQEKQRQLDLKNRSCFKCHSTGHQIRDCPININSRKAAPKATF